MAFVNDWIREAAKEILREERDEWHINEDEARAIIAKYCPFKADTAYVEVRSHVWIRGRWVNATTGVESDAPYSVCRNCGIRSDSRVPENCSSDVAYMPVPRCETCKHWEFAATGLRGRIGRCMLIDKVDGAKVWINYRMNNTDLYTVSDFGCVQWETKK